MNQTRKIMLGTAGHVDHGKTSLVKLLTGCDTDRLSEEKRRGLTIELGYAPCKLTDLRIAGIIDAPGHVDFIRNMVAGAHAVDLAIICIAADDGIMPQTCEHINVMSLMGVSRGVIALTRSDLVDSSRINEVTVQVEDLLKATALAGSPIVPLSNITGDGFDKFMHTLLAEAANCAPQRPMGNFRMWIDRVFTVDGFGTVITGIPTTASVNIGDKLSLAGSDKQWRVRKLQAYGSDVAQAAAGQCAAINLSDANSADFTRGQLIAAAPAPQMHTMFEAKLTILPTASTLQDYTKIHLHIGSAHATGAIALLEGDPIEPGESAMVQIRLDEPIAATLAERFVIRAQQQGRRLTTIAGGVVLDCCDMRLKRRRPWTLEKLTKRNNSISNTENWILTILTEQSRSISTAQLAKLSGLSQKQLDTLLPELSERKELIQLPDTTVFAADSVEAAAENYCKTIQYHHSQSAGGITIAELSCKLGISAAFAQFLCGKCLKTGSISLSKDTQGREILLPTDSVDVKTATPCCHTAQLEAILKKAHLSPPLPQDICQQLDISESEFDIALAKLAASGQAVKLDRKVVMHINAIEAAKLAALKLFRQNSFFETAQFRDELNISRKYAIAILDWFDTQRFTTRNGPIRRAGASAKKSLLENE